MTDNPQTAEHCAWCRFCDAYEALDLAITGEGPAGQSGTRQQRTEAAWEQLREAWRAWLDTQAKIKTARCLPLTRRERNEHG